VTFQDTWQPCRKYTAVFNYLSNSHGTGIARSFVANCLTAVLPTVACSIADRLTSRCNRRSTLHHLFSLSTRTGLCRECLTWRTWTRMTEDVAVVWTVLVTLPTTNLSTAVWSDILMKLWVLCFTYVTAHHRLHSTADTFSKVHCSFSNKKKTIYKSHLLNSFKHYLSFM